MFHVFCSLCWHVFVVKSCREQPRLNEILFYDKRDFVVNSIFPPVFSPMSLRACKVDCLDRFPKKLAGLKAALFSFRAVLP